MGISDRILPVSLVLLVVGSGVALGLTGQSLQPPTERPQDSGSNPVPPSKLGYYATSVSGEEIHMDREVVSESDRTQGTNITIEDKILNKSDFWSVSGTASSSEPSESERVVRTVVVSNRTAVNQSLLQRLNATVLKDYKRLFKLEIAFGNISQLESVPWVMRIFVEQEAQPVSTGANTTSITTSEGVQAIRADKLHENGITGENVSVGILSCEGFNQSHPELKGHVTKAKSFRSTGLKNNGKNEHGTAVAAIVADVAPDASLFLVNHADYIGYEQSVDWLENQGVSVIAYSCGWWGEPDTGDGKFSETLDKAALNEGIASFVAAGNSAQKHYEQGFHDPDGDGWHNFDGQSEVNIIEDNDWSPQTLEAGDEFTVELQWDQWPTSTNVELGIYDLSDGEVVKFTQTIENQDKPVEFVSYTVPEPGTYAVVVYSTEMQSGNPIEITVLNDGYSLGQPTAFGSIAAPAAGDFVAGVAAFNWDTRNRPPYSSAGPTDDGELGVLISAPTKVDAGVYDGAFTGTSAAAPHAAGVAALLLDARPTLDVAELYGSMAHGSDDVLQEGADYKSGYGQLNATKALATAPNLQFTSYNAGPLTVLTGENVTVSTVIENSGLITDSREVTFYVDGNAAETRKVTLAGLESLQLNFTTNFTTAGEHTVTVGPFGPTNITVQIPANLSIKTFDAPNTVREGENITINATIENTGDPTENQTVEFRFNGSLVATRNLSLAGDENTTVTFSVGTESGDAGEYTATVATEDDNRTVQIEVLPPGPPALPGFEDPPTDPDGDGLYEDVNGDGSASLADVQALFANRNSDVIQNYEASFDFNGDGSFSLADVQAFFAELIS